MNIIFQHIDIGILYDSAMNDLVHTRPVARIENLGVLGRETRDADIGRSKIFSSAKKIWRPKPLLAYSSV